MERRERMDDTRTPSADGVTGRTPCMRASLPLDVKALRRAVHGWWLGNPLVYKPGAADLCAVASELASAGAVSGTLVVSDARPAGGAALGADPVRRDRVRAVLLLRPALPRTLVGMAAALAAADAVQSTLGRSCVVRWPWDIVLHPEGTSATRCALARVAVAADEGFAMLDLRLAFGRMLASRGESAAPTALLARPDWREVLLARLLHLLDVRLSALAAECGGEGTVAREALGREWDAHVLVPSRAVVTLLDGSRHSGAVLGITGEGAVRLRGPDGAYHDIGLEEVATACGWGTQ